MKNFLLSITILFSLIASAQEGTIEKKATDKKSESTQYLTSGKKLGFTAKDSLFQVNIGFRIQSRTGFEKTEGETGFFEGEVRRMRFKLDGFVYNPKFGYKIELGFSAKDMVTLDNKNGNVILDAVLFYHPAKNWTIAFGQTKLPGNNQRVISSGSLEFTDRTINNSRFNIDRDFGLFVDYSRENPSKFAYSLKGALTKGEGRNWVKTEDDGIALTAKAELFPLGSFTKHGSLFEADLFEARTIKSLFFDTMLKYNGWSLIGAYMSTMCNDPITVNPLDISKTQIVFAGHGVDTQLSYVFPSNYQIAARYSKQKADSEIHASTPDADEYALGLSKYILGHKLKVQTECSYENKTFFSGNTTGSWYVRFQVEIGI